MAVRSVNELAKVRPKSQRRNGKSEELTGITFTASQMSTLSEGGIIRFLLSYIEITLPGVKPAYHLASILHCDRRTVQNIVNEKTHLSLEQAAKLKGEFPLFASWANIKLGV